MSVYDLIARDLADPTMAWKWGLEQPQPVEPLPHIAEGDVE